MEKKANKLIHESSPYLLQHAHNPVNWYPWGTEALQKAKLEDKPILVSIGYAACHWCHVMERESFENEETARIMNDNFVNIKIDREERPDLDQVYMEAVQLISGSGGWPLNVFLTPEAKPFYGGTYFPPVRAYNKTSWTELLHSIKKLFVEERQEVNAKADELTGYISGGLPKMKQNADQTFFNVGSGEGLVDQLQLNTIAENILKQADTTWGGFGNAPKFPQTFTINSLLRYYYYTKDRLALDQACLSLNKMIAGGIYDQIGGGFSRYSTDREWLAPHFEKMLYDNALIIISLSEAYQVTKNERYRQVVNETITFLDRELKDPAGGYYAAIDADSEGVEGKYYVWDAEEIKKLLGEDARMFCSFYDVSSAGNWEEKNILRTLNTIEEFCLSHNISETLLLDLLKNGKQKLFEYRSHRIRPATDDKIILGWNAMMIIALCKAGAAFSEDDYVYKAESLFTFINEKFKVKDVDTALHHNYKNGIAKNPAFLDDYATFISAAIHLQECTSKNHYLNIAYQISEYVLENFSSEDLFYFTSRQQSDIIVRKKEIYDGAVPSGNSVMTTNLFYLSIIFDKPEWKAKAIGILSSIINLSVAYPASFGVWNNLLFTVAKGVNEIAITGSKCKQYRNRILGEFIPGTVIQCSNDISENTFPLLRNRIRNENNTLIYVCRDYACDAPVTDPELVLKKLVGH